MSKRQSLAELLHQLLPEPPEEETFNHFFSCSSEDGFKSRTLKSEKRRPQIEIVGRTSRRTYRYNCIFENNAFEVNKEIGTPGTREWPGLNLYVEKGLASIVDAMIGLKGKTVVSFRPEYYPFFGIQTARRGAHTILIDGRIITAVEDLINGTRTYSHDLAKEAEQRWSEGARREDLIGIENRTLLNSPKLELISAVVRKDANISPNVWDNLTDLEKSFYVYRWISQNNSFKADANQYYKGGHSNSLGARTDLFYDIPDTQKFPFVLRFLEENFDQLMAKETWYTAREQVAERVRRTITLDEDFSLAIQDIYFKLIEGKAMEALGSGRKFTDADIQTYIVESLFQTTDQREHQRIRQNMIYRFGKELGQAEIPDKSVDVLFSGWGLDYLENSVDFVAHAARIVRDEGLFVGYVQKEQTGATRQRNLSDSSYLKRVLRTCGFDDAVIIHKKEFENGVTYVKDVGYVFFAQKTRNRKITETGLVPALHIPYSNLFPRAQKEEVQLAPAVQRRPIFKTWDYDVSLDELVSVFESNHQDVSLVTTALYGPDVTATTKTDLKNVLRGLYCKHGKVDVVKESIVGLSPRFVETLSQYYLKQQQVELLLQDLNEAFTRLNRYEDTADVEQAIAQRAETLGHERIATYIQQIKSILSTTKLSPEIQAQLDESQHRVMKACVRDPKPRWDNYEMTVRENEVFFTSIERRKQLNAVAKALSDYFLEFDYSFHIDLDGRSAIQTSIGKIHKVAIYDYFERQHQVLFVDQTIAVMSEEIQALYTEAAEGTPDRRFVFLDRVHCSTNAFVSGLKQRENLPALIQREWGNLEHPQQIVRDIANNAGIHEIQHAYGTGELGSYLAELTFGQTPYYNLFTIATMLYELADDKHMGGFIASVMRKMGKIPESESLQAAAEILPYYLDAAVESRRLLPVLEEKVCSVYSKNAAGHLKLDKDNALGEHNAVLEALAHLERDDICRISTDFLQNRFGMAFERKPTELTAHIPLIVNGGFEDEDKPSNTALVEASYSIPLLFSAAVKQAVYAKDTLRQSQQVTDLVSIVGDSDVEQALNLARTIKQRFLREIALITIAYKAADAGDIAKATSILRETEALIESGKQGIGNNFAFYSELGDSFLVYPQLVELKNRVGLHTESYDLLSAIERQFLDRKPAEMGWAEYNTLLDVAKRKSRMGHRGEALALVERVESCIGQNTNKNWKKTALFEATLARAEIDGKKEHGQRIVEYMAKEHWIDSGELYHRSLCVLADLECKDEVVAEAHKMEHAIESGRRPRLVNSYIYNCLADALYRVGERGRANQLWVKAHQYNITIAEKQKDYGGYDYGFEHQANVMSQHDDLRDEAVKIAMHITDFPKRGEILAQIGQQYLQSGEIEKGLVVLGRAEQYLNDDAEKARLQLLIQTEASKLGCIPQQKPL